MQDRENPLGLRGFELHGCFQKTAVFHDMHHLADGSQGVDNDFAARPGAALEQARTAAKGQDVRIGEGENLFAGIHLPNLGSKPVQTTAGEAATHVILKRS